MALNHQPVRPIRVMHGADVQRTLDRREEIYERMAAAPSS